jgi:BMFP domain-containing protein YqiC
MQTDNRILDGMARFFTNAAGAAQAFKNEMETMMKSRLEKLVSDLDLVTREEFDAARAMAAKARAENEKLARRIAELEGKLGGSKRGPTHRPKTARPRKRRKA